MYREALLPDALVGVIPIILFTDSPAFERQLAAMKSNVVQQLRQAGGNLVIMTFSVFQSCLDSIENTLHHAHALCSDFVILVEDCSHEIWHGRGMNHLTPAPGRGGQEGDKQGSSVEAQD